MHFENIELRNVKCFNEADLYLSVPNDEHDGVNFIIGENMSGKSTIIHGIFWSLLGEYARLVNTTPEIGVDPDYIFRVTSGEEHFARVAGNIYGEPFGSTYTIFNSSPHDVPNLYRLLSDKGYFLKIKEKSLPFLMYYPPSSHAGFRIDPTVLEDFSEAWNNFNPYSGALGVPNLNETVSLLTNQYAYYGFGPNRESASLAREQLRPLLIELTHLLDADFENLSFAISETDEEKRSMLLLPKIYDLNLPPEALSTGFLSTFAFLVDFYMRMLKLPQGRQSQACCIVDEITAFMHPSLQMKIVPALKRMFPNTQFIFTTHSPYGLMSDLRAKVFSIERNRNTSEVEDVTNFERSTLSKSALVFDADILAPSVVRVRQEFDKVYSISKTRVLTSEEKERMNKLIKILASSDQRFAILSNYRGDLLQGWDLLSSLEDFNEAD